MADKLKHTPGNWFRDEEHEMRVVVSSELGYSIADCGAVGSRGAEANAALIALAPAAPHDCEDPKCPGNINRRKLEAFEELRQLIATAGKVYPHFPDCHSLRQAANIEKPLACDCWHRRARAALNRAEEVL